MLPFAIAAALLAGCSYSPSTYTLDDGAPAPTSGPARRPGSTHMDRVSIECVPFEGTIEVNSGFAQETPVEIEVEVNELDQLLRDTKIVATFSQSLRNTDQSSSVRLKAGDVPPIKISFNKNNTTGTIQIAQRPRPL